MELSVSNDFISLFFPEHSEFTTEDILEEFKIYIFRLMNITVDSLIQEQINNEFENTQLKKSYKDFFSQKVNSVLQITSLYNSLTTNTNLIKASLDKNSNILESNKMLFTETNMNKDIQKVVKDIELNKSVSKSNEILLHILSIPSYMIDCFQNEEYDLYYEYYSYIKNISYNNTIITSIKDIAMIVHEKICKLLKELLSINYKLGDKMTYELLYDILELQTSSQSESLMNVNETIIKKVEVILYQFKLYMSNPTNNSIQRSNDILSFYESKLNILNQILNEYHSNENISSYRNEILIFIFNEYIYNSLHVLYQKHMVNNSYITIKEKVIDFVNAIDISTNTEIINQIDVIMKQYYFEILDIYLKKITNSVKNYLLIAKDVKKLFSKVVTHNFKYELLVILFNNYAVVNNLITSENFFRIEDKVNSIEKVKQSCCEVIDNIALFFNNNCFMFKATVEMEKEYSMFKEILLQNILRKQIKDLFNFFQYDYDYEISIVKIQNESKLNLIENKSFF